MTEQERIQAIKEYGGLHLKNYKPEYRTYDLCLAAVKDNGEAIDFVPEHYRTKEMYTEACKNNGMVLKLVPVEFQSDALYENAVSSAGLSLQFVPEKHRTKELCMKAVIGSPQAYKYTPIEYVTPEFVTCVAQNSTYSSIGSLPDGLKKSQLYHELVCLDPKFIWYIPRKNLTAKIGKAAIKSMGYSTTADAIKDTPELLSRLHVSLYDHDSCLNFVKSSYFKSSFGKDRHGNFISGFNTEEDREHGRIYFHQKYYDTYSLPNMMKWPDIATAILKMDGGYIEFVQEDIITDEMCKVAIQSKPYALQYIPPRCKTKEVCMLAFEKEPYSIQYFPEELINDNLAVQAVKYSGFILKYLPEKYRSKEVCLIAVGDEGSGGIENVPESILDKDICMTFLKNTRWTYASLSKIPEYLWDYDICFAAASIDGSSLKNVPREYIDEKMCLAAVKNNGGAAEYVPRELFTKEMAMVTAAQAQRFFKYIPVEVLDEEICITAIKRGDRNGTVLKDIPESLITQKMCDIAVDVSVFSLEAVPEKYVTYKMLVSVARSAPGRLQYNFPEKFRKEEIINKMIEEAPRGRGYLEALIR